MGENPLNGKGAPLTGNAEGGEIVRTSCESMRRYNLRERYEFS